MNEEEFRELQKIIDEEKERCADPCQDSDDIWAICGLRESGYDYIPGLLEHIDAQDKQIAILKANLVDAYAQLGCGCSMDHQLTSSQLNLDFVLWRNAVTPEIRAFWSEWAKEQLARELPEIFKEDKQ